MRSSGIYGRLWGADVNFSRKAAKVQSKPRKVSVYLCGFPLPPLRLCVKQMVQLLLSDRPASDARTGVPRRIGLLVVGLLMDDQRRTAIREE